VRFEFHGDPQDIEGFSDFFRTFFTGGMPGAARTTSRTATGGRSRTSSRAASLDALFGGLGSDVDLDGLGGQLGGDGSRTTRRTRPRRQDAEAEVEISLDEAFHGTKRRVEVNDRRLDVTIPRGVDTGRRIRLSGKVGSGPNAGDLYLRVTVKPHPVFTRTGNDLRRDLPITLEEALLGAEVPVKTIKGRVLLRIPAGTQNGRTFRLKAQGMPRFGATESEAPAGDLLVTVRVVLPTNLSDEAKEAAKTFLALVDQPDPRA
jgi:curved DNA-binding protein